jgi:ACT domain-containing protein
MREDTRIKLEKVKDLLKRGYSLRKAIREAGLGCKSYYKYESYVLADKDVPRPRRVSVVNVGGSYMVEKSTVDMLRSVAKHVSRNILIKKYGSIRAPKKRKEEFRQLVSELVNRWLYELLVES